MAEAEKRRRIVFLVCVASVLAGVAAVAALGATGYGPGMMGGHGTGMMSRGAYGSGGGGAGASGAAKPTTSQLQHIKTEVDSWLASSGFKGFSVAEVMAFTNNDYVAVHDAQGTPAFELLTNLETTWVMEEPPSMMWNTKYGMTGDLGPRVTPMMGGWMMGGSWNSWYGSATGTVTTTAHAVEVANAWLAKADRGERVAADAGGSAMGKFPGYYSFDTTRDGKTFGMVSVSASTGRVWYHGWHGTFLAERDFTA
jgi:hypothetical protein